MSRAILLLVLSALAIVLVGCGSGESPLTPDPSPGPPGGDVATHEVGPLVVRTASASGFVAEDIPTNAQISLVALHGSTIEYLASQAMLDRIVFGYGDMSPDIWVCNLDGSHRVQLTDNAAYEFCPRWSPDGTKIAFVRGWSGQDREIMMINADGSGVYAVTNNTNKEDSPTFGPAGRRLAFERDLSGNNEIFAAFLDGSGATNLTNHASDDTEPDWSPRLDDPTILFCSARTGSGDIYEMNEDGSNQVQRTTTASAQERCPRYHPTQSRMAYDTYPDVFVRNVGSGTPYNFSASPGIQKRPCWSSDGRFICYQSDASGSADELVLEQTESPWAKFRLTHNSLWEEDPDLGGPTMQADRVLIGPPGSDWGGNDPIWASAYAGIVAFNGDGYRSFVRIGISPAHLGSLDISPLSRPAINGGGPAGVVVEATKIVNLREDAGRGREPTVWDLDPLGVTAAMLYFDPDTGKLVSVLALDDANYPSAAGSPRAAVTQRADGDRLIVEGDFSAVFDAEGRNVAPDGAARVTLGADGAVLAAQ